MKLLTICIPTYKRSSTLDRCIESIVSQINEHELSDVVGIYVTDDASPDDTKDILHKFNSLEYFIGVSREINLGMNVNIKNMLSEVKDKSRYQLIITDDDYLQPSVLKEIIDFLRKDNILNVAPAIWTPRYSYTEDGDLHCIVCNPFKDSRAVKASAANTGRYMHNGFVLSGLILRAKYIDYEFWEQYKENSYFPVIFFGEMLRKNGAYYWNKNVVHHTVLNECHWERWGENDVVIRIRLFADYINAYSIMARKIKIPYQLAVFHIVSFFGVRNEINSLLASNTWHGDQHLLSDAIREFQAQNPAKFKLRLRLMMVFALALYVITSPIKFMAHIAFKLLTHDGRQKERHTKACSGIFQGLRSVPVIIKLII